MATETPPAETALTSIATAMGTHAVTGFAVMLPLVLLLVAALWWTVRRYGVPRQTSRLPPAAFLALHLGAGFAVMVGAALVFAEIAEEIGSDEVLGRLDQAFTDAIRGSVSTSVLRWFAVATHLGDTLTLALLGVLIAALLLATGRRWLAVGWVVAVAGNALLNVTLKHIFERVRPVHDHGLVMADGFSFPSGHTSGSLVTYGMLAYLAIRVLPGRWHLPLVLLCTAVAFTTACSRLFLQVHFASDVVAGFASGVVWLLVCIGSIELTRFYWRGR